MIHLEGMGVNGSLLARKLAAARVDFTWNDIEAEHTAWKASTGAIYPSGSTKFGPDAACWKVWRRWHKESFLPPDLLEEAAYWFGHKKPPHEGRYRILGSLQGLNMGELPSYHLNVQELVRRTRAMYADRRTSAIQPSSVERYVVTHGFGDRMLGGYWGWARLVELRYDQMFAQEGRRPSFYFRPNKLVMAYAYPVPGTPYWYAGSSIIYQKRLKPLTTHLKYDGWKRNFLELSKGAVEIIDEGDIMQGWRPKALDDRWVKSRGNVITLRPLWNSGIRHFPYQWFQVSKLLGISDHTYEDLAT